MNNRMRAHHVITAALVLGLAGCSSAASSTAAPSATAPTSVAASTPDTAATTSADGAATSAGTAATSAGTAATSASSAAGPARPQDACTLLSSDQVASAVGTPGPYNDSHEDPATDGSPVWGCTWGTRESFADIREVSAETFQTAPDPSDITVKPLSGIGDTARLDTMNPDGRNPELFFAVGGAYYNLSVTVSRSETGAANAAQEEDAERALAKILVAKLSS